MPSLSEISVQFLKGVGPARKKILENLGVSSVEDLFYLFPRRYEDRSKMTPLSQVKLGEFQTVSGKVIAQGGRKSWWTLKHVYETVIDDGTGRIFAVWFNQPYLDRYFRAGTEVVLHGQVARYKDRLQLVSPEYEIIDKEDKSLNTGRIVPIYPLTRGITQRYLRKVTHACLEKYTEDLVDQLPVAIRNKHRLMNIKRSLANIHFPESQELQEDGHRRVSFEEFFFFQLSLIRRRMSIIQRPGISHKIDSQTFEKFRRQFSFSLTKAQERVIAEISMDLQKSSPMLRLVQGDVGSGKTLVALFGCIAAFENKKQSALIAPTEILARQHFENIQKILARGDYKSMRCRLFVGSVTTAEKEALLKDLKVGKIDLVVGTHALLGEDVRFQNLSYVIIDEQHKFGVRQRAVLSGKGTNPDVLVMTATPIPRTLAYTLFGDLDVSVIDEMPPGRGQVVTKVFSHEKVAEVYAAVRREVEKGKQAYIIYPLVEESENLDLKAAESSFRKLANNEFKGLKLGLVHGQMKREEAEEVMAKFKDGKVQILVATSVLEVGIDVPNAAVMVIEHAERFGLSQLHQLRGRIGRGQDDGLCYLITDPTTEDGVARIKAISSTRDGFKIAEADLLIRGPGLYFGRHQHGINELRFADPVAEIDLLKLARVEAEEVIQHDPDLSKPQNKAIREIIQQRYPGYLQMVEAG